MNQFATDHPIFTALIIIAAWEVAEKLFFRIPNRFLRSRNIKNAGWPPAHCDADGDFKKEDQ
jgi:hypothetical protein